MCSLLYEEIKEEIKDRKILSQRHLEAFENVVEMRYQFISFMEQFQ